MKHPRANDMALSRVTGWLANGLKSYEDEPWPEFYDYDNWGCSIRWWHVTVDAEGIAWTWAE